MTTQETVRNTPERAPEHTPRLAWAQHAPEVYKAMPRLDTAAGKGLEPRLLELVRIRASQLNHCAFCLDMHSKDAAAAGETSVRLNLVAAWREATVFTESERAALELAEQGTRIADASGGVTDEAWLNATKHYDEEQLAALVSLIALINTFNRFNVIVQQPAGGYQPGQFA